MTLAAANDTAAASGPPPETGSAAEWVLIADLVPWKANPRKNDKAVDGVADSIRTFGFGAPVLARRSNGEIIAGHTRIKAAMKLGLTSVPVRYLDLDEEKSHLLAIADNKLNEKAVWDEAVLGAVLADLKQGGADLTSTGFAEHELHKLLAEQNGSSGDGAASLQSEPDKLRAKWGTALGQHWEIPSQTVPHQSHHIVCGSSTDPATVQALWGDDRADMMWTDPPYGVAYVGKTEDALTLENDKLDPEALEAFLVECFQAASHALKPGAALYVATPPGPLSFEFQVAFRKVGWKHRQNLAWVKDVLVLGRSDYHYRHEQVLYGYTPAEAGRRGRGSQGWFGGNAETSVFEVPKPHASELHPTMKPIELVARMIRNSCPTKGTVYEPFSGSGTTIIAAETSSRVCRAIELDPRYVAVALERMSEIGCHGKLRKA